MASLLSEFLLISFSQSRMEAGHRSDERLDSLSKKQLIESIQQIASNAFLLQHGLQGKISNIAAKKNKKDLTKLYKMVKDNPQQFGRQAKDEQETTEFRETFCRSKIRNPKSLKRLCMRFILARMDQYIDSLLALMPEVSRFPPPLPPNLQCPTIVADAILPL